LTSDWSGNGVAALLEGKWPVTYVLAVARLIGANRSEILTLTDAKKRG
jgi:hypothetical protein